MTRQLIFTVNPGATSTKCALYEATDGAITECSSKTIEHPDHAIVSFNSVSDQVDYRFTHVQEFLKQNLKDSDKIIACAGRGGMLTPVPSGAIRINQELVDFSLHTPVYHHASNLGAPLAFRVANKKMVAAFIVDPVSVDEFPPVARISGSPDFPRFSFVHALNTRATARKLAEQLKKPFSELRCVVAHLGAGFSISAIQNGKIIDADNRMETAAFTPERAGGIPPIPILDACFSGNYTKEELKKKLYGQGGIYAYLGTKDVREVEQRMDDGDEQANLIYEALIYQIGKAIAVMMSVLDFDLDGVCLTGGMAFSERLVEKLKNKLTRVTPIHLFPGSNENESLAETVARVLHKGEVYLSWPDLKPENYRKDLNHS